MKLKLNITVTMPELVAQTNMGPNAVRRLRHELLCLTHWLSKHAASYALAEYESPTHEYIERARGA